MNQREKMLNIQNPVRTILLLGRMWSLRLDLLSFLKQLKKIHEIMVLKTLDIWQQRTVIPERRDKHEISTITSPAYFLKAVAEGKKT